MATGTYLIGENKLLIASARRACEDWFQSGDTGPDELAMWLLNLARALEETTSAFTKSVQTLSEPKA